MEGNSQFLADLQILCQAIARGDYDGLDSLFALTGATDVPSDIRDLAESFGSMVVQIEAREFHLSEMLSELKESNRKLAEAERKLAAENVTLRSEVTRLKIEIDQARKDDEVAEIADTEYFQDLQSRARSMRARHQTRDTHPETETKDAPSQTPEEPADPNAAKVA
ncbi:MAG TPA: hypothetical protein VL492_00015 [Methylovirgula sp.]|jgi:peptidoglycan hydrolase CwlO-like protein|nr:hypothetical protein [Methylovirgula sp.]